MKKILILLILGFILCGCSDKLQKVMAEKEYIIIDVRTKEEYAEYHIVDAINIPYDEIDKDVNLDKDKNIFVYCKSGTRSQIAFNELTDLGYRVYDLGAFNEIDLPKE